MAMASWHRVQSNSWLCTTIMQSEPTMTTWMAWWMLSWHRSTMSHLWMPSRNMTDAHRAKTAGVFFQKALAVGKQPGDHKTNMTYRLSPEVAAHVKNNYTCAWVTAICWAAVCEASHRIPTSLFTPRYGRNIPRLASLGCSECCWRPASPWQNTTAEWRGRQNSCMVQWGWRLDHTSLHQARRRTRGDSGSPCARPSHERRKPGVHADFMLDKLQALVHLTMHQVHSRMPMDTDPGSWDTMWTLCFWIRFFQFS